MKLGRHSSGGVCWLQVAMVWDAMMKKYHGKWRSLAVEQSKTYFSPSADNLKQSAKMYVIKHQQQNLSSIPVQK